MKTVILFMSPGCGACIQQEQLLQDYFGKDISKIKQVNLDKHSHGFDFVEVTPTWAFPIGGEKYRIHRGAIEPRLLENIINKSSFGRKPNKRKSYFGEKLLDGINNLAYYGKNFPDTKGFNIPNSFYKETEKIWGKGTDTLNAGLGGTRSMKPSSSGDIYSNNFVNNIRMAHPSDQLGTALYINRNCNTLKNPGTVLQSPGMIFDSTNPQIVDNTTGFGKTRRSQFGNLYKQMGPAFEINNQYLIDKDTGRKLYSGARQNELPRPVKGASKTFIDTYPPYNPLVAFGKQKKGKLILI